MTSSFGEKRCRKNLPLCDLNHMSSSDEHDRSDVSNAVERLRATLTYDMAEKAYRIRFGEDADLDELEAFMEELVNEHYNAGLDEWNDEYLYYD